MVTSDKIINAPISIQDVRKTLLVSSLDLGKLATSNKINKWSKHKPVSYPSVSAIIEDIWNGTNTYGGMKVSIHHSLFGDKTKVHYNDMYVDISQDTTGFLYKLAKGQLTDWEYDQPKGSSNSPYRLSDFNRYSHKAINPLPSELSGKYHEYFNAIEGQESARITFKFTPEPLLPVGNIIPRELKVPGYSTSSGNLHTWNTGLLLYNDDLTETIYLTSLVEGLAGLVTLEKASYPRIEYILNKKFKCRSFISERKITVNETSNTAGALIPCGSPERTTRLYVQEGDFQNRRIYFNVKWLDEAKTKLDVTVDYILYPKPADDTTWFTPYWITNIRIETLSTPALSVKTFNDSFVDSGSGWERSFSASYSGLSNMTKIKFYYTEHGREYSAEYMDFY